MIRCFVDRADAHAVEGWGFSTRGPVTVEVLVDGVSVAKLAPRHPRNDVFEAWGRAENSLHSGFLHVLKAADFAVAPGQGRDHVVKLVFEEAAADDPGRAIHEHAVPRLAVQAAAGVSLAAGPTSKPGPFPADVMAVLAADKGLPEPADGWTDERIAQATERVIQLAQHGSHALVPIQRYFGSLARYWATLTWVHRNFPRLNERRNVDDKDFMTVASSVTEMFSIAHHLLTLRSYGVKGALVEFGCFKGFSTSALSHVCADLGIGLEVFDSFAGLPPSASTHYAAGDFAGSLAEVRRNVEAFGKPSVVRYHQGFFADTVPRFERGEVLCIWMDVDLEVSARDAMALLPRLPRASCVFSHESAPEFFVDGEIVAPPAVDHVLPPVADAFHSLGRRPTGRFVADNLGAVWDRADGVPVLPAAYLLALKGQAMRGI